ncbi:MAG: HAMP domain-containing sensor histidine kinase, partial [Proteiniphilum sp.]
YAVSEAYFDYIDLESDTLISTNRPENIKTSHYILTNTFPLDIVNSIGIIGHIENPHTTLLDTMKKQLMLSVSLIIIGIISLYYISRSFIVQWKIEKMRQESVNAMTHEFKRPISSAVAMTSLIPFYLERGERRTALEYVKSIEIDLNKLTQYTKRIQQISNNEKQYGMLNRTDMEIVPFFESLQNRYEVSDNHRQKIIVNVIINTVKHTMWVDMLHFSNVMDNLVENAIKYTVATPVIINIGVKDTMNDELKISVTDNGIGISTADRKHIFDKFYRVKRTETKNKIGFGLGLTYVKSIVEAHGGTISVSSELNKGSEFVIIFQG